jgi:hypothetical protein
MPVIADVWLPVLSNCRGGACVPAAGFSVEGIAWDGGHGIRTVELSTDAGATWDVAELGQDYDRFAFRPRSLTLHAVKPGPVTVIVRATNNSGAMQPGKLSFNPAGCNDNVMQSLTLNAA